MADGNRLATRVLGKTGLEVTDIGLGCWAFGGSSFRGGLATGWAGSDIRKSLETIEGAWQRGITFYDTADAYGRGKSEVLLGMSLGERKDAAVIGSKVGNSLAAPGQFYDEPYIRGALDASLTRMERSWLDIYLVHDPKIEKLTDELFDLMKTLKAEGKVKYWGVSLSSVEEGQRSIEGGADIIQIEYSILKQDVADALLPLAREKGVGVIARVPLATGWLSGKFDENTVFPEDDHRSWKYPPEVIRDFAAKVKRLDFLLDEAESLAEAALRFVLSNPDVGTVIPGAKNLHQLEENLKASGKGLSESALKQIAEVVKN